MHKYYYYHYFCFYDYDYDYYFHHQYYHNHHHDLVNTLQIIDVLECEKCEQQLYLTCLEVFQFFAFTAIFIVAL